MELAVIYKIAVIGILTAVANMLLKKAGKEEIGTLVAIAGLILSIILVLDMISQLFQTLNSLFDFF